MKKQLAELMMAGIAMGGGLPDIKISKPKNGQWQKHYDPPRSMTQAEKEYYAIHKNLTNFKPK